MAQKTVGFHACAPAGVECTVIAKYKKDPSTRKLAEYLEPFFGSGTVEPIVVNLEGSRKGYSTQQTLQGSKGVCANLNPAKSEQRRRLIHGAPRGRSSSCMQERGISPGTCTQGRRNGLSWWTRTRRPSARRIGD